MKRFLTAGILALCLVSSQIAHAQEDRNAQIKTQMIENYLVWQEALKNTDAERIISFESPEFTLTFAIFGQPRNKSESDAHLRSEMRKVRKVHAAHVEIKKLTIEPHRVVVLHSTSYDNTSEAEDSDTKKPSGKFLRIKYTQLSRDIWVQYGGAWMLKRCEIVGFSGGFSR